MPKKKEKWKIKILNKIYREQVPVDSLSGKSKDENKRKMKKKNRNKKLLK